MESKYGKVNGGREKESRLPCRRPIFAFRGASELDPGRAADSERVDHQQSITEKPRSREREREKVHEGEGDRGTCTSAVCSTAVGYLLILDWKLQWPFSRGGARAGDPEWIEWIVDVGLGRLIRCLIRLCSDWVTTTIRQTVAAWSPRAVVHLCSPLVAPTAPCTPCLEAIWSC